MGRNEVGSETGYRRSAVYRHSERLGRIHWITCVAVVTVDVLRSLMGKSQIRFLVRISIIWKKIIYLFLAISKIESQISHDTLFSTHTNMLCI